MDALILDWFSLISVAFATICFAVIAMLWHEDILKSLTNDEAKCGLSANLSSDKTHNKMLQNRVYKRWGAALVALGLAGFTPSITKAIIHHQVWSAGSDEPHTAVDNWLYAHIAGALVWAAAIVQQLISGGSSVGVIQKWHRAMGWVAVISGLCGLVFCGGFVWTIHYDFVDPETRNIGVGLYTLALALGASVNMIAAVRYARARDFGRHKDHALMAIMWTMDPAVHRSVLWLMHWSCYSCFISDDEFEERAHSLLIIAKMPANVILFSWCLCVAVHARRVNRILVINGSGQYVLWTSVIFYDLSNTSLPAAIYVVIVLLLVYVALLEWGRRVIAKSS